MGIVNYLLDVSDRLMGRPFLPPRYVALCEESFARRMAFWETLGEAFILGFQGLDFPDGSPDWPSLRRGYVVISRGDRVLIATDSLSDPFLAEKRRPIWNGFGFELIIDAPAEIFPAFTEDAVEQVCPTWPFELVYRLSMVMPFAPQLIRELRSGLVASTELELNGQDDEGRLPPAYVAEGGVVGILAGGLSPGLPAFIPDMPLSEVRIVPITVLTADELVIARYGEGNRRLLSLIQETRQINDPTRESVLTHEPPGLASDQHDPT